MFEIRQTPTKGLGAFATQNISTGTVILREKPVLKLPNLLWTSDDTPIPCSMLMSAFDALDEGQRSQVKELYARIPPVCIPGVVRMVDLVMSLRQHPTGTSRVDYVELMFIMSTNEWKNLRPDLDFSALYLQLSRFNHSCVANAVSDEVSSADASQLRSVRARRDIQAGEEITVEYMRPWAENRAAYLRGNWGFDCQCPLDVTGADSTMDQATRLQYENMFQQIRDNDEEAFQGTDSTPDQILTRHQRRVEALEFLGPSNDLLNEYAQGAKLYMEAGDKAKLDETLRALYRVTTVLNDENDPYRLALKSRFS
ncbi:hypothetical protein F5B18DRAFT_652126 [Nemania serpens]|nr:hypothetical protein F5B18DRAFT_652126 [Nemania serpens]